MHARLSNILKEKPSALESIPSNETVFDAAKKMSEKNIGSILIMDNGDLKGIFTERDILKKLITNKLDPMTTHVKEIMTPKNKMFFASPDTTVAEAMKIMTEKRVRHLPIIADQNLLGMISSGDLTKSVIAGQEHEISSLIHYISGEYQ